MSQGPRLLLGREQPEGWYTALTVKVGDLE